MKLKLSHNIQLNQLHKLLVLFLMLVATNFGYSQSGKDGALTISTTNTVLNRYTRVTADVPVGSSSVTVSSISELNRDGIGYLPAGYTTNASGFSSNTLQYGDLILLFQAQGAIIDTSNSINYGDLTNLNNAGKYELAYVGSVSGNTITLNCKTRFAYFAANYVQCIRIPQYTTLTVNTGASVVPIKWGDPAFGGADPSAVARRRGGFLGIIADYIVSNGSINANAAGFRGGTFTNGSVASGDVYYKDYVTTVFPYGSEKGESIAGYRADYDAMGGRYGMGAPANGGGGGNGHNCGGGGGANGGDPSGWFRGAGVMNHFGTCGSPGAWALDPNYIANGNALTNSSGGGHGGYSYSQNNSNACTVGPSYPANFISAGVPLTDVLPSAWGGDKRKAFGGMGGRPLISPAIDRQIFFGGGGGAGDGNNNAANDGGDGGGVVFLIVNNSITGSGVIQANGENGANTQGAVGNDAPGGGGGGGTILVQSTSVSSLPVNANGGAGGSQIINLGNEGEGVAGGGGGGAIYMNTITDASTKTVNGGANGTTNSVGITEFIANGATSGNVGSLSSAVVYIDFATCLTDLKIEKTADTLSPILGNDITFSLTASNLGQNDAVGVNVTDLLSSGYTFVSATPSVGTYDNTTGIWTIGNLANGAVATITIVATVNLTGIYINTATIAGDVQDPITANNTATVTPVPTTCTVGAASATPTLCINSALTAITHATTGATGIGTPTGLPTGVSASWSANVITISGTPTQSGVFNYSIPLTSCSTLFATGTITIRINTVTSVSTSRICVNTALTPITITTTLATGIGTATGLPTGVTASWSGNVITISGTPTSAGTFNYSIPLTGGCGSVNATGTIIVTNITNTVSAASSTPTLCVNIALTPITHTTTQATGIGTPTGLPTGVSAVWSSNTITIFGAPTSTGVYNYSIPLTGGCSAVNATGTITVNGPSTVSATTTRTVCVNVPITNITITTTFATSIGTATGMPPGITASLSANVLTISGTPTTNGVYNYTIPVNGPCANVNATGTITVVSANVPGTASSTPTLCINTALTAITFTTGAATGISNAGVSGANGLPTGVSASWATNTITITGTPTQSGTFNYSIPLTGGCGTVNSTGTITVRATNTAGTASSNPTLCINTALTAITRTTTGATGIGTATGLPTGVTSSWLANVLTISGTPTVSGTFNYTIPLTSGCGTVNATGTITVTAANTAGTASSNPTLCINTALTAITRTTTGATGIGTATGLPTGVSAAWSANILTVSGTPTASGTFNYTIPLTGGCGAVNATGTITVIAANTPGTASSNPTLCINTALTAITRTTTGATGISNTGVSGANGLPTGVSASWTANVITVSGTPTVSGTFNYSIPLTGGCGAVNATGTITVTAANTAGTASSNPTLCISTALTSITRTTTGATGIGVATGLPTGVTSSWLANVLTISGTPTVSGTFNYTIPLTGGCGTVNATGTITVTAANTAGTASSNPTLCINTALTAITRTTTGATGIGTATGLPTGVSAAWSANILTVSGTPTASGTFNYTIPLTGGCGAVNATGTITVSAATVSGTISGTATVCTGTNSTILTLGGSTGTRQWQSASSLGGTYTNISGATGTTYTATNLTATTYYQVVVTSGVCSSATSSVFTLTVSPTTVSGTVASAQTICTGTAPANFTLSGNTGTVTNWQKATNVGFTTGVVNYANTTTTLPSATVGNLTSNTYFRATIQSGACTIVTTTPVLVTVSTATVAGTITGSSTVCTGTNSTTLTLGGSTGTRQWQSATSLGGTYTNISGATATTYVATNLTATTYYRVVLTNGACSSTTIPFTLTVSPAAVAGTISGATTVCTGTNSTVLTLVGNTGTIQWQSANALAGPYSNIPGATTTTHTATNLTATNYRQVVVTNGACSVTTPRVTITVNAASSTTGMIINTNQTICSGSVPSSITLTGIAPVGSVIKWQSASNATFTTSLTDIANTTTTLSGASIGALTTTTYFRAVIQNGVCAVAYSPTCTKTVNAINTGLVTGTTSLCTGTGTALTISGHTAGAVLQWQSATSLGGLYGVASGTTTNATYNTGNLTVATPNNFQVRLTVTLNGVACIAYYPAFAVTVSANSVAGTISGGTTVCTGTNSTVLTLGSNTGTVQWQSATALAGTYTNISGATSQTYSATNLTANTYYKAVVKSGACASATTATAATIIVSSASVGGAVSSNQTLCTVSAPSNLTLSGHTGSVVKWQKSATSDFATPTDIASTSSTLTSATIGTVSTTTYFRAVVQNSVCTTSNSNYVTIDFVTYGGIVSGTANVCSGTQATDLTLSGYSGSIVKWQKSATLDFASPIDIASTSATLAGTTIGNISATTYFRAVVLHAICGNIYSTTASMNITTTTWNGTSWDNGVPTATTQTIMTGNYTSPANGATDNLYMCNLTVTNGAIVNVLYGDNFIVTNEVTVVPGSSLTFESNANLVQINNVSDSGNIIVKRNTNFQKRMDYVLWSTPVVGQNLKAFSPLTFVSETVSRFYDYNSLTNQYKYIFTPEAYTFATGKGYLIRMPNTFSDTVAATFYGQFTGVPNNGDITVSVVQSGATDGGTHTSYNNAGVPTYNVPNVSTGYNAIGNPYPSTLDLDSFIIDNGIAEAIYFWRKTNNTTTSSYATYTRAGGVRNTEFTLLLPGQVFDYNQITPSGVLQVGQGFIFKSVGPTVTFTNSMRFTNNVNQFFRNGNIDKNRIWLNLSSETATYNQTMVSYMTGATDGVDAAIDGKYINDCQTALTSLLNNTEYVIQGKGLPFVATDIVPLAFKNTVAGNYTITLDHVDGLFSSGTQDIYLKDNVANMTHDLKQSAYTFASDAGVFNSRFELVYNSSPLATQYPVFNDNSVVVYKQNEVLNVNTGSENMKGIKIFDVRGRLLYEKSAIGATSLAIKDLTAEQQVLIVEITSVDGKRITKKIVY